MPVILDKRVLTAQLSRIKHTTVDRDLMYTRHKVFEWFESLMHMIVLYDAAILIFIIIEEL